MSVAGTVALIGALKGPFAEVMRRFFPDKDEAQRATNELIKVVEDNAHQINLAQIAVNQVEAASPSLFKGGWRPATGWTCVIALFNNFVVVPYVEAFTELEIPTLDWGVMAPILLGMLGLGAMRTWEKTRGVAAP